MIPRAAGPERPKKTSKKWEETRRQPRHTLNNRSMPPGGKHSPPNTSFSPEALLKK